MKVLIFLMLTISQALAADLSPVLDPNKFTVCAMTINSDDEKKVFAAEMAKHPEKFNPIVELTTMGTLDTWFANACKSGVRCDQLVISGHFAGEFFSHDNPEFKLPIEDIEKAGCAKTCEGILAQPYEVFLFGCNTLAGKEGDSRTPAQYLQVLLKDGIPLARAELIVESRYGAAGDSNKATMQRAFAGEKKQIYGFDSIGPSGESVKGFLRNYFAKSSSVSRLEKLQGQRMVDKVDFGNELLATSLKNTAFTQCEGASEDNVINKNICSLRDENKTVDQKLAIVTELMAQENYLLYLPALNNFFNENDPKGYTEEQKKSLSFISHNDVIKKQILSLVDKTKSIGLKDQWMNFAVKVGFMNEEERKKTKKRVIVELFNKPISENDLNILCELKDPPKIEFSDLKRHPFTINDVESLQCLGSNGPEFDKQIGKQFLAVNDKKTQEVFLDYIAYGEKTNYKFPKEVIGKVKSLLLSKTQQIVSTSLYFLKKEIPADPVFKAALGRQLYSKDKEAVNNALGMYYDLKGVDTKTQLKMLEIFKNPADKELQKGALNALMGTRSKLPEVLEEMKKYIAALPEKDGYKDILKYHIEHINDKEEEEKEN